MRFGFTSDALGAWIVLGGLVALLAATSANAQPVAVPPTWGGDF